MFGLRGREREVYSIVMGPVASELKQRYGWDAIALEAVT
jgi:hypothetical protein